MSCRPMNEENNTANRKEIGRNMTTLDLQGTTFVSTESRETVRKDRLRSALAYVSAAIFHEKLNLRSCFFFQGQTH